MAAQHSSQPPTSCANPSMSALGENINYKKKYKALKRKMQMLVYVSIRALCFLFILMRIFYFNYYSLDSHPERVD